MGLKGLLESAIPMVSIQIFGTFGEFESNAPDRFMHYFVSMHVLLAHRNFFIENRHRPHTIVLTPCNDLNSQLQGFSLHLHQCSGDTAHQATDEPAAFGTSSWRTSPNDELS